MSCQQLFKCPAVRIYYPQSGHPLGDNGQFLAASLLAAMQQQHRLADGDALHQGLMGDGGIEHDMHRANARARQHSDGHQRRHRQGDEYPVPRLHAPALHHAAEGIHLLPKLAIAKPVRLPEIVAMNNGALLPFLC